jgi:phage terminase small subunit
MPSRARRSEPKDKPLNPKQEAFAREYLVDLNATQAAIRAGYSPKTAGVQGFDLLKKPQIAALVQAGRQEAQEKTGISAQMVLRHAWAIATADARELAKVKVGCCRHCYGEGHRRQRTVGEMNADREMHREKGKDPIEFDEAGGIGFDPHLSPHAKCPECGGDGEARVVLADTANLTPEAAVLYAGAKQGKYGIEIQMHDKQAALDKLFRHLGLYERDNEQSNPAKAMQALLDMVDGSKLPLATGNPKA